MDPPGDRRLQQPWVRTHDAEVPNRLPEVMVSYEVVFERLMESEKAVS